jgi:hypothetical protein
VVFLARPFFIKLCGDSVQISRHTASTGPERHQSRHLSNSRGVETDRMKEFLAQAFQSDTQRDLIMVIDFLKKEYQLDCLMVSDAVSDTIPKHIQTVASRYKPSDGG